MDKFYALYVCKLSKMITSLLSSAFIFKHEAFLPTCNRIIDRGGNAFLNAITVNAVAPHPIAGCPAFLLSSPAKQNHFILYNTLSLKWSSAASLASLYIFQICNSTNKVYQSNKLF
jgi:hypothetical protein